MGHTSSGIPIKIYDNGDGTFNLGVLNTPGIGTFIPFYGSGTPIVKVGSVVSTSTGSQVLVNYVVTAGKTLYLSAYSVQAFRTVLTTATAPSLIASVGLELPATVTAQAYVLVNPPSGEGDRIIVTFAAPIPTIVGNGTLAARIAITPALVASTTFIGNFIGYEQ